MLFSLWQPCTAYGTEVSLADLRSSAASSVPSKVESPGGLVLCATEYYQRWKFTRCGFQKHALNDTATEFFVYLSILLLHLYFKRIILLLY